MNLSILVSMKPDISQALLSYDIRTGRYAADNFAQYSPAYAVTNEDVREILSALKIKPNSHILTVAGSGDQALHYKLSGASHVDTFDITYNAKMIMDIKTTAIQNLPRSDYALLVSRCSRSNDICDIPQYQQIEQHMPTETREYIRHMRGMFLTRGGPCYDIIYNDEYTKLQKLIAEPFNFIWTDLPELSSHLTQKYDQIYLSNILQYHAKPEYIIPLVNDLSSFLNPGGTMMVNVAPFFVGEDIDALRQMKKSVEDNGIGSVKFIRTHLFHMCVLQKR